MNNSRKPLRKGSAADEATRSRSCSDNPYNSMSATQPDDTIRLRRTIHKEQMCSSILLFPPTEISNDTVYVLCCWHQYVNSFELLLGFSVRGDRFNHCGETKREHQDPNANVEDIWKYIQVTFSSKISYCLRTDDKSCCECSSTTRIFHRPGGFTDLIASRNSASVDQLRQTEYKYLVRTGAYSSYQRQSHVLCNYYWGCRCRWWSLVCCTAPRFPSRLLLVVYRFRRSPSSTQIRRSALSNLTIDAWSPSANLNLVEKDGSEHNGHISDNHTKINSWLSKSKSPRHKSMRRLRTKVGMRLKSEKQWDGRRDIWRSEIAL